MTAHSYHPTSVHVPFVPTTNAHSNAQRNLGGDRACTRLSWSQSLMIDHAFYFEAAAEKYLTMKTRLEVRYRVDELNEDNLEELFR